MAGIEGQLSEASSIEDASDNLQQREQQPEELGSVKGVQSSPAAELPVKIYDPRKFHDLVRSVTNYSFIGIFALTVIASLYVAIWHSSDWTTEKDLLQILLPAETALLGSAVGFYFGSQANKPDGK